MPDLIFLDVMMPKMDGWAVLTALKADPKLMRIPVVMLTIVTNKEMGYVLGASEYLTKPIDRDRLADVIDKYRPKDPGRVVLVVDDDPATRHGAAPDADQAGLVGGRGRERPGGAGARGCADAQPHHARSGHAGDGWL